MKKIIWIAIAIFMIIALGIGSYFIVNNSKIGSKETIALPNYVLTLDDTLLISDLKLNNTNNLKFSIDDKNCRLLNDNTEVEFLSIGEYQINIFNNSSNYKVKVIVLEKIENLKFQNNEMIIFYNKIDNAKDLRLYANNEEIDLAYFNINYDNSVIQYNNGKIIPIKEGETNLNASIKNHTATLKIKVVEWNYASNIEFNKDKVIIKEGSAYKLSPNITYINTSDYKDEVKYTITEGQNLCSLVDNKIIASKSGEIKIKAEINSSQNTKIYANQKIIIEPQLDLKISLTTLNNEDVKEIKSGIKADGTYEYYKLKISSNLLVTNEFINKLKESLKIYSNIKILENEIEVIDSKVVVKIAFTDDSVFDLKIKIEDKAENYSKIIDSNIISIKSTKFISDIIITTNNFIDSHQNEYSIEKRVEDKNEIYTIYNCKGNTDDLNQAILDKRPYYFIFELNTSCECQIINDNEVIVLDDNKISRINAGVQAVKFFALDGSLTTKTIYIEVLEIEAISCDLNLLDSYDLYIDGENSLEIKPIFSPIYASIVPNITYNVIDNNSNKPHVEITNNIINAKQSTASAITVEVMCEKLLLKKSIQINIYDKKPLIEILNDKEVVLESITQNVGEKLTYYVTLNGEMPSINSIRYEFYNKNLDKWQTTLENIEIDNSFTTVFYLKATTQIETKLRIIIDEKIIQDFVVKII